MDYLNKLVADFRTKVKETYQRTARQLSREYSFTQYKHLDKYIESSISLPDISSISLNTIPDISMPDIGTSTSIAGGVGLLFGPVGALVGAGLGYLYSTEARKNSINNSKTTAKEMIDNLSIDFEKYAYSYFEEGGFEVQNSLYESFCSVYNIHLEFVPNVIESANMLIDKNKNTIKYINNH